MESKIKVGAVSYLNTKPLVYGFEHGLLKEELDLIIDYPSRIAQMLIDDEIDLGLIPVAAIPQLREAHIVSDYCIGADGEVASVCLFSHVEMTGIKTILLDYQSRTSVALLKILCRALWKIKPDFEVAGADYIDEINGTTAGLIIGDRALQQRPNFKYIYDLALGWKELTDLPFVFAAWVSNKKLDAAFIKKFNAANQVGLDQLEKVIAENPCDYCNLKEYYTKHILYMLNAGKKEGLDKFLGYITNKLEPQAQ